MSDFLSTVPTADLQAMQAGDLSKVSTSTLQALQREQMKNEMHLDPTEGMSTTDKVLAGAGDTLTSAGRAMGLSSLAEKFGLPGSKEEAAALDKPLDNTTAGKVGQFMGVAAAALPTVLVPGANTYAGATALGALVGGAQTEGDLAERVKAAALGAAGGAAGKAAGDAIGAGARWAWNKATSNAAQAAAANVQKDAAAVAGREAGYVLPPSDANPTVLNEALNGLSGKIKTQQVASARNQAVTDTLARKAIGIQAGDEVTADALQSIRNNAAKTGYEPIRSAGTVITGPEYKDALSSIAATSQGASRSFPGLKNSSIEDIVGTLKQDFFDAGDAIDATKMLRQAADKAYRQGDNATGKAYKSAATAIEEELDRHLTSIDQPEALQAFRNARQLIAKTYSVQSALNGQTGQVAAKDLAKQAAKGRPLTDELKTVADFSTAFPQASQSLKSAPGAVSPLDWAAQLVASAHDLKNPLKWPILIARPAVRSTILSKPYQSAMLNPSYQPGALARTMLPALSSDVARRAGLPLGVAGALSVMNPQGDPTE